MTLPADHQAVHGYRPIPLDLAPFRAGTVWHHGGAAYFVAGVNFDEATDSVGSSSGGAPAIYQARPSEVRVELRRATWLDDAQPQWTVDITGATPLVLGDQAWSVVTWSHGKDGGGERWLIRVIRSTRRDTSKADAA